MDIDVIAFNNVEELDLAGPYEVLGGLQELPGGINLHVVASTPVICCAHNLFLKRTKSFKDPPGEILVIPGGRGARTPSKERNEVIKYISTSYPSRKYTLSVCTGAFLLAEAGILSGKTVTTHKNYLSTLKDQGFNVIDHRIVQDGTLITCQGVTSGIDAALFLVSLLRGKEVAQKIADRIEYPLSIEFICSKAHIIR